MILFVNSGDSLDGVWEFASEGQIRLPILMDPSKSWESTYNFGDDGAYAPYPRQVLLNREHEITYLSRRYDTEALTAALDAVLE